MATGVLEINSTVRGYHVYKRRWTASDGETLQAEKEEPENPHDRYAVSLIKEEIGVVGHVPKKISRLCHSFLSRGGTIIAVITGPRQFAEDLPQGGLDIPCAYIFTGEKPLIRRVQRALRNMNH